MRGLESGFHIGYSGESVELRCYRRNHPSSLANPVTVIENITAELLVGRLIGPRSHHHCMV